MEEDQNGRLSKENTPSPLILGSMIGGSIGVALALFSFPFGGMIPPSTALALIVGFALGFATGGIFAPITALFVRDMDVKKVALILTGGTVIPGIMTILIGFLRTGENMVILTWPVGILGYWFSFVFRKELVWLVDWISTIQQR